MSSPTRKLEVYISTDVSPVSEPYPVSVQQAYRIFNAANPFLDVETKIFNPAEALDTKNNPDYVMVNEALKRASDDAYVIICKDTTVSTTKATHLLERLQKVIAVHENGTHRFDVMWLAKWLDNCENQVEIVSLRTERGMSVVETTSPHGIQCLMFSPEGRQKFLNAPPVPKTHNLSMALNAAVKAGSLKALAFQPSPLHFDVKSHKHPSDYAKLCECADAPGAVRPEKPGTTLNFFIFIVIAVVVAVVIYGLIHFGYILNNAYDTRSMKHAIYMDSHGVYSYV